MPCVPQATELAEYSAKIALLEEAKKVKEEEAESWHTKVSFLYAAKVCAVKSQGLPGKCQNKFFWHNSIHKTHYLYVTTNICILK